MPIILGRKYTAVLEGTATKHVLCERCGHDYAYVASRAASGAGFSPFWLMNTRSQTEASEQAERALRVTLERAIDVVPCPRCGHFQRGMVRLDAAARHTWMQRVAWIGLLGGSVVLWVVYQSFTNDGRRPNPVSLSVPLTVEALLTCGWATLLVLRRRRLSVSPLNRA